MADFLARLKPKKSSTAGEVPVAQDLEVAELAVNTADAKLFVKHTDNSIKEIAASTPRASVSVTTGSLSVGAAEEATLVGVGKSGLIFSLESDVEAWVSVYTDTASRTADIGRGETVSPTSGSGVLLEVITTTPGERVKITPGLSYHNDETVPVGELYLKVVNKSANSAAITVTVSLLPLEA